MRGIVFHAGRFPVLLPDRSVLADVSRSAALAPEAHYFGLNLPFGTNSVCPMNRSKLAQRGISVGQLTVYIPILDFSTFGWCGVCVFCPFRLN